MGSVALASLGVRVDLDDAQSARVAEATGFTILQGGKASTAQCQLILTEGRESTNQLAAALAEITAEGAVLDLKNHEVQLVRECGWQVCQVECLTDLDWI